MCELFCVSARKKIKANSLLHTFFSHSVEHPNGWGMVLFDREPAFSDKEAVRAIDSERLENILKNDIDTSRCIAHIRKATIGELNILNTHPFFKKDASGREWVLAHNGTIFDSPRLSRYQYTQEGTTDSERILLYIVDEINERYKEKNDSPDTKERFSIIENAIESIASGNKLNLLIYDGDFFYIHKNQAGTLYQKNTLEGVIISTTPLDSGNWDDFPQNQLVVFKDGEQIYKGKKHDFTYIHDEEKMKLLYLAYAGL